MKKTTLVLGGIRSGKSHFAEQRALYYSGRPAYIATAIPFDDETRDRIDLHRQRRRNRFEVFEEPLDITAILSTLQDRVVLVDCMTLNLSNRLLKRSEETSLAQMIDEDDLYLENIQRIITDNHLNAIFVGNEVGLSPVEPNRLGRYFQDLQGRWNRILAERADDVYIPSNDDIAESEILNYLNIYDSKISKEIQNYAKKNLDWKGISNKYFEEFCNVIQG